jgi:hypothetical protein
VEDNLPGSTRKLGDALKCTRACGKRGAAFTRALPLPCRLFLYVGKLFSVANL